MIGKNVFVVFYFSSRRCGCVSARVAATRAVDKYTHAESDSPQILRLYYCHYKIDGM